MKKNKRVKIKNTIYQHIINNSKEYVLVTLIFVIGIFLGVMFINNTQEAQMSEITSYLNNFIDKLKNMEELNTIEILKTTIFENIILAIALWFFGTTVIRNTNRFWNNIIQRILFRLYNIINYSNYGNGKGNTIYIDKLIVAKYNIYT